MTQGELRIYLSEYREERHFSQCLINILQCHLEELETLPHSPEVWMERRQVLHMIETERERMRRKTEAVKGWTELISDETHRQIFIDRYFNYMLWESLTDKYCYSRTQIFQIHRDTCSEIVSKTLFDLKSYSSIFSLYGE